MAALSRRRAPNKTPEEVYLEAAEQIERARATGSRYLQLGKGRRSLQKIPPLNDLPNLRYLDISRASITNLDSIENLPRLERLTLQDTELTDISAISRIPSLRRINLSSTRIDNITPLAALKNLTYIDLDGTYVTDISPLSHLTMLARLDMAYTPITNIEALSSLKKLDTLYLPFTNVSDLSSLSDLYELETLDLSYSKILDITALGKLPKLKTLRISGTKVSNIAPLRSSESLQIFAAGETPISDLSPLQGLKNVRILNISNTPVHDITPISNLSLSRLDIDSTKVSSLDVLSDQTSLYRAAKSSAYNGIWCSGCPLIDPNVKEFSELHNPERTIKIIEYLRNEQNLPPVSSEDKPEDAPPDIPGQGPGPHFAIEYDGVITFAPAQAVDESGNNLNRLESLKPLLLDAAETLINELSSNEHPHLKKLIEEYRDTIDREIQNIDFSKLYGLGLRLQNSAAAAERQIFERILPPLEDHTRESLESLTNLHGPFILSTKQGLDLIEIAERYQRRPEAEREIRDAAHQLGQELQQEPDIIDSEAAEFISEMAKEIDRGPQPERGTTYSLGMTRNLSIVLIAGATCGAMPVVGGLIAGPPGAILGGIAALIGVESLKKSASFGSISQNITAGIDKVTEGDLKKMLGQKVGTFAPHLKFVLEHENILRRLAGDRVQFRWLHAYLDWLKAKYSQTEINTDTKDR